MNTINGEKVEFSMKDLAIARSELAGKIMEGRKVGDLNILALIDIENDKDKIGFQDQLDWIFRQLIAEGKLHYLFDVFLYGLAMKYITEESVLERAEQNALEREE